MSARALLPVPLALFALLAAASAQAPDALPRDAKRVTVSQNNDGSQTNYEIDGEARKAVATTIGSNGKLQSRIRYDLDDAGRYLRGEVFDARDELLFKTAYKYDAAGRLQEETQRTKDGAPKGKLVYSYDQLTGRQTGYSAYDAAGKLLGQSKGSGSEAPVSTAPRATPTPAKRAR